MNYQTEREERYDDSIPGFLGTVWITMESAT
jgi:hypothetical protein